MSSKNLSGLYIEFAPVILPAFSEKTSHWLDYEALKSDNITTLRTAPVITACHMSGHNLIDIDCHIEDDAFDCERHGVPHGDSQFEQQINDHIRKALGVLDLPYTPYYEQSWQRGDMISLDAGYEWSVFFETISHHRLLEMAGSGHLTALHLGPLSWGTRAHHMS